MLNIRNPFRMPTAEEIAQQQLTEARREVLRHQALVEEHSAAVSCYKLRIARLEGSVVPLAHPVAKGGVR